MQYPYFGPKKTLKWMEQNHPIAFVHYKTALEDFSVDSLKNWITYIKNANDCHPALLPLPPQRSR